MYSTSGRMILFLGLNEITVGAAQFAAEQSLKVKVITNTKQKNNYLSIHGGQDKFSFEIIILENISEISDVINFDEIKKSLNISVGAPWIIPGKIISEVFDNSIFNLHGSYLPKDRGGNLFSWQILSERRTGICLLHRMTSTIDGGGVAKYKEFLYPDYCRLPADFIREYDNNNIKFLQDIIENWKNNELKFAQNYTQPEYLSSYWPRLMASVNGWVNWNWNGKEIEKFICAFDEPYPGARTHFRNKIVILRKVYFQRTESLYHPYQVGIIHRKSQEWLHVMVEGGELLICGIYNTDGDSLFDSVKVGDRLYTKNEVLEESLNRVIKTSGGLEVQKDLLY